MKSKLIKISQLKNNTGQIEWLPKNPRILKDDKYNKLVKSIQEDPEMLELREVIAYDNDGELVDGRDYGEIIEIAREYIKSLGGFEKLAEWGLV